MVIQGIWNAGLITGIFAAIIGLISHFTGWNFWITAIAGFIAIIILLLIYFFFKDFRKLFGKNPV